MTIQYSVGNDQPLEINGKKVSQLVDVDINFLQHRVLLDVVAPADPTETAQEFRNWINNAIHALNGQALKLSPPDRPYQAPTIVEGPTLTSPLPLLDLANLPPLCNPLTANFDCKDINKDGKP